MGKESRIQLGNLLIIVASFLAVVLLIFLTDRKVHYWHLFVIPILLSAVTYNLGGGLATWVCFTAFIIWSKIYLNYPSSVFDLLVDTVLGLSLVVGFGIYAGKIKRQKALLEKLSQKDSLTGLENYSCFVQRLTEERNRSDRYETLFSLIIMDIDYFKKFNDSYGHEAGNEVLKKISETIQSQTRTIDLGARYGGEEFAVILTNADPDSALRFAQRLRESMSKLAFDFGGESRSITISIGVATYPLDAKTETELIVYADQALYQAKAEGRNRVCAYSSMHRQRSLNNILV